MYNLNRIDCLFTAELEGKAEITHDDSQREENTKARLRDMENRMRRSNIC